MKKRVTYFDLAKGIGIILVVLGHMENIDAPIRIWIASFHMPLFFVISGMLIALKGEDSLAEGISSAVKKKAKGILIPYFWFSLMYIPIDIMNVYINTKLMKNRDIACLINNEASDILKKVVMDCDNIYNHISEELQNK